MDRMSLFVAAHRERGAMLMVRGIVVRVARMAPTPAPRVRRIRMSRKDARMLEEALAAADQIHDAEIQERASVRRIIDSRKVQPGCGSIHRCPQCDHVLDGHMMTRHPRLPEVQIRQCLASGCECNRAAPRDTNLRIRLKRSGAVAAAWHRENPQKGR